MDDAHRTLLDTQLTANTLVLVDACQVVLHSDSLLGAGLGTLHAADTAGNTGLPGIGALILILAQDHGLTLMLGDDRDDRIGSPIVLSCNCRCLSRTCSWSSVFQKTSSERASQTASHSSIS